MPKILFTLIVVVLMSSAQAQPQVRVLYYPRAVYANEYFTLVAQAPKGADVVLSHNQNQLQKITTTTDVVEISVKVPSTGVLTLKIDTTTYSWSLVGPREKAQFELRTTHLYNGDFPVILMPHHKHPPKVDREWEVAKWLLGTFSDTRLVAQGPLHIYSTSAVPPTTQMNAFALDRLIVSLPPHLEKGVGVLVLSLDDIQRGMDILEYRLRLEWMLQRLQNQQVGMPLFVQLPAANEIRRLGISQSLFSLALDGNGARMIYPVVNDINDNALRATIKKEVRLP